MMLRLSLIALTVGFGVILTGGSSPERATGTTRLIPDSNFATDGILIDGTRAVHTPQIAKTPEGSFLVTSGVINTRRMDPNGEFDTEYGVSGYSPFVAPPLAGRTYVGDIRTTESGGALLAATTYARVDGFSSAGSEYLSLKSNGKLNRRFRGTGYLADPRPGSSPNSTATAIAPRPDGRILVAGGVNTLGGRGAYGKVGLISSEGNVVKNFASKGAFRKRAWFGARHRLVEFTDIEVLPRGDALISGILGTRIVIYRMDVHGKLRKGFGSRGRLAVRFAGYPGVDTTASVPGLPAAKIVRDRRSCRSYVLFRDVNKSKVLAFNTRSGKRISRFGRRGVRTIEVRNQRGIFRPNALELLKNGQIVLAGSHESWNARHRPGALVVMRKNGSIGRDAFSLAAHGVGNITSLVRTNQYIYAAGDDEPTGASPEDIPKLTVSKYRVEP